MASSSRSPPSTEREEVIVVTITYDHAARRRSYELLADEFDLRGEFADRLRGGLDVTFVVRWLPIAGS